MTLAMAGIALLAVVVFLFVLEPVLRARGDEVVLDASALPRAVEPLPDGDQTLDAEPPHPKQAESQQPGSRIAIDRPAGSDAT
jgi:hypothetical protein